MIVHMIAFGSIEWSVLHTLNDFLYRHDGVEDPLLAYINVSEALFVVTLVLVFLLANGEARRAWRRAALAAVLSAGVALAIAKVLSEIVDRARPFVVEPHGVHLFTAHAADPGFPSDHATGAFAVAMAIYLRNRAWGALALVAAAVLAVGRVAIGVHFPSDVLAGAVLGCAVALALFARPLRSRIDGLADLLGGWIESVTGVIKSATSGGDIKSR
ncbi:MAG: phosphatase PAP2 family protein [Actinobacteria bacterium]|nr:phosphatase PAP2 family protein [Actinomycetota bacterium]